MAAIEPTAIRQRVAAAIAAAQSSWRPSRFQPPLARQDTRQVGHLAYTVALGETLPVPLDRRVRASGACGVQTALVVELTHRLRGEAMIADLDAASDAGHALVLAVLTAAQTNASIEWLGTAEPNIVSDGTLAVVTARFRAVHTYALQ